MRLTITLCILMTVMAMALATPLNLSEKNEWSLFKDKYGKKYSTKEEDNLRMKIFLDNKERIKMHNEMHSNGLNTHKLGINKFADLTSTEFRRMMNGYKGKQNQNGELYVPPSNQELPASVDWRTKGAVTGVKNQAQCGSCWAFSATGSLEGQHFLKNGELVSLSEQNLVDCSGAEGNEGCDGGLMDQAFDYIKKNKGIDTESSYKYTAQDGKCQFKKSSVGATCSGYKDIESGNETALQSAVAAVGPVSVAIDARSYHFQLYESGVYYEPNCSSDELDHGVLAVGYGTENGNDYWLVKNSWGDDWGISGYIKMSRNRKNNCGIATQASYPLV